jgi:hypothetical protein
LEQIAATVDKAIGWRDGRVPSKEARLMHKLMLGGTALSVALSLPLGAHIAWAKAGDPSPQRSVCRLAAAASPLKLLRSTVVGQNGMSLPAERISRRANYSPVPSATNAREPASFLVLLERQSKPTTLMVGVGF